MAAALLGVERPLDPGPHQVVLSSYETMRILSGVGFIAGGVLAATGIVLVIADVSGDSGQVFIRINPSGLAVNGQF